MISESLRGGTLYNADTFDAMRLLPDNSIDMLLVDLPYGTTACKWDTVIPFEDLWKEYYRVCGENAAMVFTATQPFSSALVMSNPNDFAYEWMWDKVSVTGFVNAKKQPLRHIETVLVFYRKPPTYNAQGIIKSDKLRTNHSTDGGATLKGQHHSKGNSSFSTHGLVRKREYTNWPRQLLRINRETGFHPTQKPVELFEYLIRTYTNEGQTVLDNTSGSGTTAIAAINSNRKWIRIERDEDYYSNCLERIHEHTVRNSIDNTKLEGLF